ncbi:hypothetical protein Tco_0839065 [Tanacetum coccineum]|uniref:Uncharacterized protein n=1 Tax=Tanacetum coccineum TaxID=301880 RepID=A0ABQ5ATJ9_9ASTR
MNRQHFSGSEYSHGNVTDDSINTHNDYQLNAEVETLLDSVDGNRLPTTFEGDGTTVSVSRIFDRFRSLNIGGSRPISTMNTVSPIYNQPLSTSSLSQTCMENHLTTTSVDQTVYIGRNTERCFTTARSTMADNVDRIPTYVGIIGRQDTGDRTTVPIRRVFDRFRNMRTPRPQSD